MPTRETEEVDWNNQDPASVVYMIGIYGWRKRFIYFLILVLMVITIVNLSLVIWVMRVMDFNLDGMGKLRITDQGLKLYGEAEFVKELRANMIRPRHNSELTLQSTANVTVNARDPDGNITGQLFIGNDEVVARNQKFSIKTERGKDILYADKDKIVFKADKLEFLSPNGAHFSGSVETESLRAPPKKDLRLASLTRSLHMDAPNGMNFKSAAGSVRIKSLQDVTIKSMSGKVVLNATEVSFKNLKTYTGSSGQPGVNAREVCICTNGKIFLAAAQSHCQSSANICD
ncbi:zeta-sarcoglycan-like [Stylophora pistillata]|uniref:zeta-sarcoglycan-like n=1 Tax=Stylophora pistillata TaxID=50429 RepID=UPI000C057060|nr:zeta-sarcoglycan-like [Stylophora pistillata]XP_022786021.1 zeta-sarcoglycan-like [Stylophora pistillata]